MFIISFCKMKFTFTVQKETLTRLNFGEIGEQPLIRQSFSH